MASLNISLIITNYNGKNLLEKSLPFIKKAYENKKNRITEIIIVDDASTDGSRELIKTNYPEFKIVVHKINRGFSATVNTGVRATKGRLVAILNNDVYPEPDFLEAIIGDFENTKVFAVSLNEQKFGPTRGVFRNGFIEHDPVKTENKTVKTFWVSGGSGVWRRDIWIGLGGMDEKLLSPFYWEDIDLSYRAQKRGYLLLWESKAKVIHNHESTISKLSKKYVENIRERNQLIFVWKNLTSNALFRKHLIGLAQRIVLHPGYIRVLISALMMFSKIVKAREIEAKESKVSDEALFQSFT